MNNVKIKVYENNYRFIKYLISNNIYYSSLECNSGYYILIVDYESYKKINRRYKCSIIKYYGKNGFVRFIDYHKYMIISFVFSLIVLFLLSNTIFEVRINCEDKIVKNKINNILISNGITKYKRIKSFKEVNSIKNKILNEYEDYIEWIGITSKGCIYIVDVSLKVKDGSVIDNSTSSIYAANDGVIKKINVIRGSRIVDKNDYVKKGDLLISGNILKDNTIIRQVKASGSVYAEVWHTISVSVPFDYMQKYKTGKIINHFYLDFFGNDFTLLGKYNDNNTINKKYLILDKPYLIFKVYKEVKEEYKYKKIHLSNNEAYLKAISLATDKINNNLKKEEYIISKKVLKKKVNYSKMYVEVFFKVYENIGVTSNIDIIGDN